MFALRLTWLREVETSVDSKAELPGKAVGHALPKLKLSMPI